MPALVDENKLEFERKKIAICGGGLVRDYLFITKPSRFRLQHSFFFIVLSFEKLERLDVWPLAILLSEISTSPYTSFARI
jgi:hypothetical protein